MGMRYILPEDSTQKPRTLRYCFALFAILTCLTAPTVNADDCIKKVFNRYCLGGDIEDSLAGIATEPKVLELDNNQILYTLDTNGKTLRITSENSIVQRVVREEKPGGWINYTAWKVKLIRLYGRGKDLSSFPPYASSRSSRLNAINAGRGSAEFRWDQDGYSIALVWKNPGFLELQYVLEEEQIINSEGL